jgi:ankyrin repeat protein
MTDNTCVRSQHGTTSLMMAANNGHFPALRRMLDAARTVELDVNAVMNVCSERRRSLLRNAVHLSYLLGSYILFHQGGTTALMLAVIGNIPEETQEQMVAALLQAGADASIANEVCTRWTLVAAHHLNLSLICVSLRTEIMQGGVTAYRFACQYGKTKIARILRPPL